MQKLIELLEANDIFYLQNEPLSAHTTFKIGGNAAVYIETPEVDDLKTVLSFVRESGIRYFIIGKGSNLLVSDNGFNGAVIRLTGEFNEIMCNDGGVITAGAGAPLINLCTLALNESLSGAEFAYGIPGSVGGAVFMNAGAYGGEIKDILKSVIALAADGSLKTYSAEEAGLSYRHSIFEENGEIILFAEFALVRGDQAEIRAKMDDLLGRRKDKQPLDYPSAGSTFKRPEGYFAGALIEQCGLKGFSVGGAQVSKKHAGFVVNRGGATCADVTELIRHCQKTVKSKFGVELETEVKLID